MITHSSAYFKDVDLSTDDDRQALTLQIKAATDFVERYCNRHFEEDTYSEVYTALQDGCIVLNNPPCISVDRICYCNGGYLTLSNTTAYAPSYSTTETSIKIAHVTNGVRSTSELTYAAYKTLGTLATAIQAIGSGWVASVQTGKTSYPSSDIVALQFGGASASQILLYWEDYTGWVSGNVLPTRNYFQSYDASTGILDWCFPRGIRIRVDYTGGYEVCPPAISQVIANLVLEKNKMKSESLGSYSYTMQDVSALPMADQRVLAEYKDRTC